MVFYRRDRQIFNSIKFSVPIHTFNSTHFNLKLCILGEGNSSFPLHADSTPKKENKISQLQFSGCLMVHEKCQHELGSFHPEVTAGI